MSIYRGKNYTYLIGWSNLDVYYYGVRYAKKCHPKDLWVTYFTSSSIVKNFIKYNGEPDIKEIRKTFKTEEEAVNWESKVLRRLNVPHNKKFLNGHCAGGGYKAHIQASKLFKNTIVVIDNQGNHIRISKNDVRYQNGELVPNRKNKVSVKLISTDQKVDITVDEYNKNKHLYHHHNTGRIHENRKRGYATYIVDGGRKMILVREAKSKGLKSSRTKTSIYKNVNTGEVKILEKNSPLVLSGEYVGINKNKRINTGPKPKVVCCIETRKEYTLSCWIQHIRAKDKRSFNSGT